MRIRTGAIACVAFVILGCSTAGRTPPPVSAPPPAGVRVAPQRDWSDAVLYFAITDRFADAGGRAKPWVERGAKGTFHGGDWAGLAKNLDEIAGLGATAVWITPVVKNIDGFVTGAGFPDWAYHGYWTDDFTRLDPRWGTEADLKALVDACHARGMKVVLDVVYNHVGYESRYLKDPTTRDWLRSNERGNCGVDDLEMCVGGLPDWKTERPEVAEWLLGLHVPWAKKLGVDGFRLDTVKHIEHSFWKEHRRRVRKEISRDFFLVGEVWGGDPQVLDPYFAGDEMDAGFDFAFQGNTIAFVQGRGRAVAYDRYLKSREKTRPGYLLAHFLSSHDVPGALFQLEGDVARFRLAAILQFVSIGVPVVYYGEEVARPGGDWPDNRSDMPWGARKTLPGAGVERNDSLREDYRRLIAIRRAHRALARGVHSSLKAEGDLLAFLQVDAATGDTVIVAVNRGTTTIQTEVPVPAPWKGRTVRDAWLGGEFGVADSSVAFSIPPLDARILVCDTVAVSNQ